MKMAKSIKLQDDNYIDTSGIMHDKVPLNDILNGNILYENSSGSTTTTTLSDDATNYKHVYIELTSQRYTEFIGTTGILIIPENKSYSMSSTWYGDNNQIYTALFRYTISGDTITINRNQAGTVGASTAYWAQANVWAITKVVGYK